MQEEVKRVIEKLEKTGWLVVPESLSRDALAAAFVDLLFKDMTVRKFLNIFKFD